MQECPKRFLYAGQLKAHMTLHTGEKPYSCEFCSRKYRLKKSMEAHMRTHTGEKPHQCKYCSDFFKDYNDLRRHLNSDHKEDILSNFVNNVVIEYEGNVEEAELIETDELVSADDVRGFTISFST